MVNRDARAMTWRAQAQVVAPDALTGETIHKMKRALRLRFRRVLRGNTVTFNSVLHTAMHNRRGRYCIAIWLPLAGLRFSARLCSS
jgi:hypothetical protein